MGSKTNPTLIGGFIIGALGLLITAVLLFAGGAFSQSQKNIIYFEGSVNGLNIGALVKLKGVAIGKVTDILVIFDEQHGKIITPVVVEFQPQKILDTQGRHINGAGEAEIKRLVAQGLRAQLQMQSLLTGQLFVDINFRPETPVKLIGGEHPLYPEIPSIPSPKEQLENTVEEAVAMARKLPIQQTMEALLSSIQQVEKLLKSPEIPSTLATLDQTMKDLRQVVNRLDGKIDPLSANLNGTLKESQRLLANLNRDTGPLLRSAEQAMQATTGAMGQAQSTLATVEQATGQNASLDMAMRDLGSAAKSLRVLADYLERHPDALLYGKKPEGE